jgi:hypothetical protein
MKSMRRVGVLLVALFAGGCGDYGLAPVSGRVTLNGLPLADAYVSFQPIGDKDHGNPGPGSFGKTDADGRFTLRTVGGQRTGAVIGKHRVTIRKGQTPKPGVNEDYAQYKDTLPARYNAKTELELEVVAATDQADFALTTP